MYFLVKTLLSQPRTSFQWKILQVRSAWIEQASSPHQPLSQAEDGRRGDTLETSLSRFQGSDEPCRKYLSEKLFVIWKKQFWEFSSTS